MTVEASTLHTSSKHEPLVSFIIPCYNVEQEVLHRCLQSVVDHGISSLPVEVIVVDDGSDVPPVWVEEVYGTAVTLLQRQHEGVSAARNAGLDRARGTYIQFVDADDMLLYAYCNMLRRAVTDKFDIILALPSHNVAADNCQKGTCFMRYHNLHGAAWGYLFRRTLAEGLRFTPGVAYAEDEEFTARLFLRAQCLHIFPEAVYEYRQNAQSVTRNISPEALQRRFSDTEGVLTRLKELCTTLPDDERHALQRRVAQLTTDYIYNVVALTRDRQAFRRCLDRLHQLHLLPLPNGRYTWKYALFRSLCNRKPLRGVLFFLLKHLAH